MLDANFWRNAALIGVMIGAAVLSVMFGTAAHAAWSSALSW